jgi:hypothetical protein
MLLGMQQIGSSALSEFFLLSMCAKWPDHRAFSRISLPLSGEDGKGTSLGTCFYLAKRLTPERKANTIQFEKCSSTYSHTVIRKWK